MRRKWWRGKNNNTTHRLKHESLCNQNKKIWVVSVELDGPFSTVCPNQHTNTHTPMHTHSQNTHRQMQVTTHIWRHARHYTMVSFFSQERKTPMKKRIGVVKDPTRRGSIVGKDQLRALSHPLFVLVTTKVCSTPTSVRDKK